MELNIQSNISLKPFNTFGIEEKTNFLIEVNDNETLTKIFKKGLFKENFFILGAGSNVLFTKPFNGYIIRITSKGITVKIESEKVYVSAKAGEVWNDFVWYCIEHNYAGIENMALIPGTVGASPVQNIGAYGTELMDVFYACEAFDTLSGTFNTFKKEDCNFSYRDSIFKTAHKGRFIITEVTYKLSLTPKINTSYGAIATQLIKENITQPSIADIATIVSKIRVEKLPDPSTVGNAGSFFKNPVISTNDFERLLTLYPAIPHYPMQDQQIKLAAGWLIEQCGWKGKEYGQAGVWKNQALVLINRQNASGQEIYELSVQIIEDVKNKFGIVLEREVNLL
ncbi:MULTISPECIES: UDP-N-acetylmuramate dehydrogenase [unclassified Sphingobacterium]|uniref:UDP-N-acetylmuramate dehydrogenase n=1 Tax=unclassified Sphingobacterium TaxID=2609468 RepID=UPI0025DA1A88|nr:MULTISPECIES: UDP-N-acetylmuramate dehydrogenase [unclassified Sphingobacterium]